MYRLNAYLEEDGYQELLLKDVVAVYPEDGGLVVKGRFGDCKRVSATIEMVDLMAWKILLKGQIPQGLPEPLQQAKAFHGHLGPIVSLGVRMGRIIVDRLGDRPFSFKIVSYTGKEPPFSCLVDGLQVSTPCTVGNGRIEIAEGGELRAVARGEQGDIEVRVREEIRDRIEAEFDKNQEEVLPVMFWEMSDEELFEVIERWE